MPRLEIRRRPPAAGMPLPSTRPAALATIIPAVVGDLVALPDHHRTYVALERCPLEPAGRQVYACLNCRQKLANAAQLAFHLEAGGAHVIVRLCLEHGWETLS